MGRGTKAILCGGLAAGTLDGLYAIFYFGWTRNVAAHRIFQHISSGLFGPASFQMGWKTIALGVALHFSVATGAATTFWFASRRMRWLVEKPMRSGPLFGIAIYIFMNYVVIPLSRVVRASPIPAADVLITGVLVHLFLIGLPIALIARNYGRD